MMIELFRRRRRNCLFIALFSITMITIISLEDGSRDFGYERSSLPVIYFDNEERDLDNLETFEREALPLTTAEAKLLAMNEGLRELSNAPSKRPVINGTRFGWIDTMLMWRIRLRKFCDIYEAEGRMNRSVMISPWQTYNHYDWEDVTMVSHLNLYRMNVLDLLLSYWPGPASIAISLKPSELHTFFNQLSSTYFHLVERDNVDLHIIRHDGYFYPVNDLRNVALKHVKTRFVVLNDIDFIPQAKAYSELRRFSRSEDTRKNVYIVPAFETLKAPELLPQTRKQLFKEWKAGNIKPTHFVRKKYNNQGATNYTKWISSVEPYKVKWESYYEPYIFAEAAYLPEYDIRFVGSYVDKVSYFDHLAAIGFNFYVLPELFLLHFYHPIYSERNLYFCALELYHFRHFPRMRKLWSERGEKPPATMYSSKSHNLMLHMMMGNIRKPPS